MATDAETRRGKTRTAINHDLGDCRTELNFCEFPIFVPYSLPADKPFHSFATPLRSDRLTGEQYAKQVKLYPDHELGYTTLFDDRVFNAMVTLAQRNGDFASNRVNANRYDIASLLEMNGSGATYERILESANRLAGIKIQTNTWLVKGPIAHEEHEKFSLIDRANWKRKHGGRYTPEEREQAFFVFGDKVYENLKAGNVRQVDFGIMNRLARQPVAYRTYSLLMKRFHFADVVEFRLQDYYEYHLGRAAVAKPSLIKNRIRAGLTALEEIGFIAPQSDAQRFYLDAEGGWRISFAREKRIARQKPQQPKSSAKQAELFTVTPLADELIGRGLGKTSAADIVSRFSVERIRHAMDVIDWRLGEGHDIPSPHGLLFKFITDEHPDPTGYISKAEREAQAQRLAEAQKEKRTAERERKAKQQQEEENRQRDREARAQKWEATCRKLDALPATERHQQITMAVDNAGEFIAQIIRKKGNGEATPWDLDCTFLQDAVMGYLADQ